MRIVLIRPNSYVLPTVPPMGLASLAAWLRLKRGDDVNIIDARKRRLGPSEVAGLVAESRPDVVGIGALSVEGRDAHEVASAVKKAAPGVPVVMGGPFASADSPLAMSSESVDYAVEGEGEMSFGELLAAIERSGADSPVKGVWGRYEGKAKFGGPIEGLEVDELPTPAWELLPIETYFQPGRNTHDTVPAHVRCLQVMTSRGCPFACIYCHGLFGKTFRPRSPEKVVSEIAELVGRFDLRAIEICDDIFNLDMERAKEILRGIVPLRLFLSFPNGIRADRVDDELLDLMEEAGARRVSFAVESASPRIQKVIRKGLDLKKVEEVIEKASRRKFLSTGFFMLGLPGETSEEMDETIRFAQRSGLHIASFFYLTAFPGTEAAKLAEEKGLRVCETPRDYSTLEMNLSAEPDEVLKAKRREAYRKFYAGPRRIWRTFMKAPKNRQSLINAWRVLQLSRRDSVDY